MRQYQLLLFVFLFFGLAAALAAHPAAASAADTLKNTVPAISHATAPDMNNILLQYEKMLQDDMKAHRDYIESLLRFLAYFLVFVASVTSALLYFFGSKSFRDWRKSAELSLRELYDKHSKKLIDELWAARAAIMEQEQETWRQKIMEDDRHFIKQIEDEFSKKMEGFNGQLTALERSVDELSGRLQSNIEKDDEQQASLTGMSILFRDLASRMSDFPVVQKSKVILTYLQGDGSELRYEKYQELICETSGKPVKEALESLAVGPKGKITELDAGYPTAVITPPHYQNSVNITYPFTKPLKKGDAPFIKKVSCKFINAFTAEKEWLNISQVSPCNDECYELHLHPDRPCKEIYLEKLDFNGEVLKRISEGITKGLSPSGDLYRIVIPVQPPPYKYRLVWAF